MCFDSKVADDPKRLSFQLTSSEVSIFCLRYTFVIILRVNNCRACDFMNLDVNIRKTKKYCSRMQMYKSIINDRTKNVVPKQ